MTTGIGPSPDTAESVDNRPLSERIATVLVAAERWVGRIDFDGGSPPGMWADDQDEALIDAVFALQGRTRPDRKTKP